MYNSKESRYKDILCELLGCGYLDISVIEDCQYDFSEMIEEMKSNGYEEINLNNLAYTMFDFGKRDIANWIQGRIEELKTNLDDEDITEQDKTEYETELAGLETLEPYDDIESFHNFLDTSVYFGNDKEEIYKKYCSEALKEFTENTGFDL